MLIHLLPKQAADIIIASLIKYLTSVRLWCFEVLSQFDPALTIQQT